MINVKSLRDIDGISDEGQLLIAALAILTSITEDAIKSRKFGGYTNPDEVLGRISDLANKLFIKMKVVCIGLFLYRERHFIRLEYVPNVIKSNMMKIHTDMMEYLIVKMADQNGLT